MRSRPSNTGAGRARSHRIQRSPALRFFATEAASGILLIVAAAFAFAWANSPWADGYEKVWTTPLVFGAPAWGVTTTVQFWVNDVLMSLFFLNVGLEIRREIDGGSLATWRRAALPLVAAVGGMVVPALLYLAVNVGTPEAHGFGIPMATDIAFAVGVLGLLGERVPRGAKVLLLALAVIDDIGAVMVIAFVYSARLSPMGLPLVAMGALLIGGLRRARVRALAPYLLGGVLLWFGAQKIGIHPTLAGVALGLGVPVARIPAESTDSAKLVERDDSPAAKLQRLLHRPVAFLIMPLFALANAGVHAFGPSFGKGELSIVFGIAIGLVLGKPLGVVLATFAAQRLRLVTLPRDLRWRHLAIVGSVAGIGFTMALFTSELAFRATGQQHAAKVAVLLASIASAVLALGAGRLALRKPSV